VKEGILVVSKQRPKLHVTLSKASRVDRKDLKSFKQAMGDAVQQLE
jgi:hypothetical protein